MTIPTEYDGNVSRSLMETLATSFHDDVLMMKMVWFFLEKKDKDENQNIRYKNINFRSNQSIMCDCVWEMKNSISTMVVAFSSYYSSQISRFI